ncbi:transketolase [Echinops telfairi]|uniref:Transketolase n=1 Tax=Echinops telfairi TaxID=9371 RepID=A0ABM0ZTF0_ECHTE|nr:transketolase [Echinops telfairi]
MSTPCECCRRKSPFRSKAAALCPPSSPVVLEEVAVSAVGGEVQQVPQGPEPCGPSGRVALRRQQLPVGRSPDTPSSLRLSHPTSCCSAAEIMSVLFFHTMRYKAQDPRNPHNDRFVLSKGHAAPILYAVWAEAGFLPEAELLNLRKISSDLDGHPVPKQAFTDVATGSLGQGLGAACGMAFTGKYFDKASYRVYCMLGDGELSEGSVWEAMAFASIYKLDNLVAILDINRLGQSDPAPLQHQVEVYQKRCEAFGWHAVIVDGHSVEELCKAFGQAKHQPTAIIAKTFKGRGIAGVEDKESWHGKPLPKNMAEQTVQEIYSLIQSKKKILATPPQEDAPAVDITNIRMPSPPSYKVGDKIATRKAYGQALAKLGHASDRIIALDGDTKNSTFSDLFRKEHPDRFIECYIAEQNMVSLAVGCATRSRTVPFISAFAAFFTRAFDQIRMAAISESNINLCGSHCGVSIGEDGPSQMALEDLAMFRSIPMSTVFYPSDGVSTEKAVELAANTKVEKISIRVLDPFTIKPLDVKLILESVRATKGRVLTVEDHYHEGGIGEAVSSAIVGEPGVAITCLAVSKVPRSGKPMELLKMFGIDRDAIAQAVRDLVARA